MNIFLSLFWLHIFVSFYDSFFYHFNANHSKPTEFTNLYAWKIFLEYLSGKRKQKEKREKEVCIWILNFHLH